MDLLALAFKALLTLNFNIPSASELDCIYKTVYHEARGESDLGKYLVVRVIKNRVNSEIFPNSYCEVVSQPRQFVGYMPIPSRHEEVPLASIKVITLVTLLGLQIEKDFDNVYWFKKAEEPSRFHSNLSHWKTEGRHKFFVTRDIFRSAKI
jgi:hypothetical protein